MKLTLPYSSPAAHITIPHTPRLNQIEIWLNTPHGNEMITLNSDSPITLIMTKEILP